MSKAAEKAAVSEKVPPKKVLSADMQRAEFSRPHYRIIVRDLKTTVEDVLKPEYWVNVGRTFQGDNRHPFPIVELVWADGSRYLEVLVLAAKALWAKVVVLQEVEIAATEEDKENLSKEVRTIQSDLDGTKFEIKYINQHTQWAVIRLSDGERLNEGMSKEEAQAWLNNYEKALAR